MGLLFPWSWSGRGVMEPLCSGPPQLSVWGGSLTSKGVMRQKDPNNKANGPEIMKHGGLPGPCNWLKEEGNFWGDPNGSLKFFSPRAEIYAHKKQQRTDISGRKIYIQ